MKRNPLILFVLFALLLVPRWGHADDAEVYKQTGCKANVLVIFDNSTSMGDKVPYDPSYREYYKYYSTAKNCCPNTKPFETDKWYYYKANIDPVTKADKNCCCLYSGGWVTCTESGCHVSSGGCKIRRYVEYVKGTSPIRVAVGGPVDSDRDDQDDRNLLPTGSGGKYENTDGLLYKGNYLNWLIYYDETKYDAAANAVKEMVKTYGNQIDFGMMVFRKDFGRCPYQYNGYYFYYSDGGELIEPIGKNKLSNFQKWLPISGGPDCPEGLCQNKKTAPGGIVPNTDWANLATVCSGLDASGVSLKPNYDAFNANRNLLRGGMMFTPLAESLTHAGMYFEYGWKGGSYHWATNYKDPEYSCPNYNRSGFDYVKNTCKSLPFDVPLLAGGNTGKGDSPITRDDQRNYVIIMTDGNPANDANRKILSKYLTDAQLKEPLPDYRWGVLGWYMEDRMEKKMEEAGPSTGWLPEQRYLMYVTGALYKRDLRAHTGGQTDPNKTLTTHIIGFGIGNDFLRTSAENGGGKFVKVGNSDALEQAFKDLAGAMVEESTVVNTATIPASGMVSGNSMYVPFAYTAASGPWPGDLKKYEINRDQIKEGVDIIASSVPIWSAETKLKEKIGSGADTRNIYTYLTAGQPLNGKPNLFDLTNSEDIKTRLNITGTTPTSTAIIRFIRGFESDGKTPREKLVGDILHSSPLAVQYSRETLIYVGANDGMLHAIDELTGSEKWAFIPPSLLPRLQELYSGADHPYFVDGSPKLALLNSKGLIASSTDTVDKKILVFGLRKGGNAYYALNITNPSLPEFLWAVSRTSAGSDFALLGQTWSEPVFGNIKVGGVSTPVAIFGGGYPDGNGSGKGVYAVDILTGKKVWSKTVADLPQMNSIPSSVLPFDIEEDGIIDRIYVGDLSGQMWVFNLNPKNDKDWSARLLFQPGVSGLKIFYPPELSKEKDGNYLYFGTGDRENPRETTAVNRLYCVKDKDLSDSKFATISESALVNLTADDLQESTDEKKKGEIRSQLEEKEGWLIQLENAGEKCLASVTVFLKVAYYTTFTPVSDPCSIGGEARVYAVHYTDGQSVLNWDKKNDNKPQGPKIRKGKTDRVVTLSLGGIPSEVLITVLSPRKDSSGKIPPGNAGGLVVPLVASGGGITMPGEAPMVNSLTPYSWRTGSQ